MYKSNFISLEGATNRDRTLLEQIRDGLITYKGTVGEPMSLTDIGKVARVEPITVVSKDLSAVPEMYDILHGLLDIYTAFYLQAVSILSADLQDIRILKILDKTNPDRDIKTILATGYTSYESRSLATVSFNDYKYSKYKSPKMLSLEAQPLENFGDIVNPELNHDDDYRNIPNNNVQYKDIRYNFDKMPSAVGKIIEVTFNYEQKDGKNKNNTSIVIPVLVKLDTMVVDSEAVDLIITNNEDEITFTSRLRDAIKGKIHFIKDFILCSDLIKNQKKAMMKDTTGTYTELLKRISNSRITSVITGNISMAAISSIFVISEENEKQIQAKIGGNLSSKLARDIVFNNTSAMMIVVVDRQWQRVSMYIRDIDGYTQRSFKDFKSFKNNSGDNIADILKAFSLGHAPTF